MSKRPRLTGPEAERGDDKEDKNFQLLSSLPVEMTDEAFKYLEYNPTQQTVSKEWNQWQTERCARETSKGSRCLQSGSEARLRVSSGCTSYCVGRQPCLAWLEPLMRDLRKLVTVQPSHAGTGGAPLRVVVYPDNASAGPYIGVSTLTAVATAGIPPIGKEWEITEAPYVNPPGWFSKLTGTRKAAEYICKMLRRYRAGTLNIDVHYSSVLAATVGGHNLAFLGSAPGLPRKWSMMRTSLAVSSAGEAVSKAVIDLWEPAIRACHGATRAGRDCLRHLLTAKKDVDCTDYCVRRPVPCEAWLETLLEGLVRVNSVAMVYVGAAAGIGEDKETEMELEANVSVASEGYDGARLVLDQPDDNSGVWYVSGHSRSLYLLGTPEAESSHVVARVEMVSARYP